MTGFGFVAAVTGLFFLIGGALGALAVIAASALRGDAERTRRGRAGAESGDADNGTGWTSTGWAGGWTDTISTGWEEPPEPGAGGEDDAPPGWPGGPGRG